MEPPPAQFLTVSFVFPSADRSSFPVLRAGLSRHILTRCAPAADYVKLGLALIERKREVMIALRNQQVISDSTLLLQSRLDREALRLNETELFD